MFRWSLSVLGWWSSQLLHPVKGLGTAIILSNYFFCKLPFQVYIMPKRCRLKSYSLILPCLRNTRDLWNPLSLGRCMCIPTRAMSHVRVIFTCPHMKRARLPRMSTSIEFRKLRLRKLMGIDCNRKLLTIITQLTSLKKEWIKPGSKPRPLVHVNGYWLYSTLAN